MFIIIINMIDDRINIGHFIYSFLYASWSVLVSRSRRLTLMPSLLSEYLLESHINYFKSFFLYIFNYCIAGYFKEYVDYPNLSNILKIYKN